MNAVILKSLKISTNFVVFKKEVLIFFQGFLLQKLKAEKKSSNEHKKIIKKRERKRKDCFFKCQELINASFTDQKRNSDPYSNTILNCCAPTWKSLFTSLSESVILDHLLNILITLKESK